MRTKSGSPVGKIARRLGVAPTAKAAKILTRRPTRPGQHGGRHAKNQSVFGQQLIEKQKLRFFFMLDERQLRRVFKVARQMRGSTGENLLQKLDSRLDSTLFRSGIVASMLAARQLVTHRHVFVNGRRVNKPSYELRPSDQVTFSDKIKQNPLIGEAFKSGISVAYIDVDRDNWTVTRRSVPARKEIPVLCDEQAIVEYYSR